MLTAAVIASGAQGRVHANGYAIQPGVRLAAVADVDHELARRLADEHGATAYSDYRALIDEVRPDLLSVCTPPAFHRDVVEYAIRNGVRGIHCEKPIALTWDDAREMVGLAAEHGVAFSINHQRRFDVLHRAVRDAIVSGEIGDVVGLEGYCANLFDWGSHTVDLMFFYLGDVPAEAVLGALDVSARKRVYGALTETAAVSHIRYRNGVNGIVITGRDYEPLSPLGGNGLLVHGRTGRIEVFGDVATVRSASGTRTIHADVDDAFRLEMGGVNHAIIQGTARALAELAAVVEGGGELTLDARHGLAAAEVVFATYESSARRGRVELPLETPDNALVRGLELGYWSPTDEIVSTF